jgi:ribose/xylose/arabinose/galactoside ABC-type transport system permease subunit
MQQSVNKVAGILLLLVLICVGTTLLSPGFMTSFNVVNNLRYISEYGIIGIGVAFVIITGGIDLSIGSVIGLIGCLLSLFLMDWGWSVPSAVLAVMAISLAIGLAHGLLITKMKLQPFVVTLCGLLIYRGLARWITGDQQMGFGSRYDDSLRLLATGKPCSVPFLMLCGGVILALLSGWRLWRLRQQARTAGSTDAVSADRRNLVIVTLIIGLTLTGIGGSRFLHKYEINRGETLVSIGPIDIPSWSTTIPTRGIEHPQELMQQAGLLVIPGLFWLVLTVLRRRDDGTSQSSPSVTTLLFPFALMVLAGLTVWGTIKLIAWKDPDFWGGAEWARTWRMTCVLFSLSLLMGSLAWFGHRTIKLTGGSAIPPLVLTSSGAILWLLGKTQLNNTLVPTPLIMLLALAAMASVFLNQTIYGRYLLALGNNEEAARFSGIQTDRMVLLAYVLCSLIAGLGAIIFALDTNALQPQTYGSFYELYAIAAAVLGGCSLRGGEGTILGVVIGAALIRVLYNAINLTGLPPRMEFAIIGTVILLGVLADEIVKRVIARGRTGT